MRKICLLMIILLAAEKITFAQFYTWNGSISTDYQVSDNWTPSRQNPALTDTLSFNATASLNITNVANQTIGAISIAAGSGAVSFSSNSPTNVLTLDAAAPLIFKSAGKVLAGDFLTIALSSSVSFTLNTGTFGIAAGRGGKIRIAGAVTIGGGSLDVDVVNTGGTVISGPLGRITYNFGDFSSAKASAITWGAGANYFHNAGGSGASAIPVATWQAGSTCNITGMNTGTIAPTGFTNASFANLTWNCASQSGNINWLPGGSVVNITGTLGIISTGSGATELRVSTGRATVKAAAYLQSEGNFTLQAGEDTTILSVAGNFSHTGGILNSITGAGAGTAIIDLKGNVTRGAAASWQSTGSNAATQIIFQFSGTAIQAVNVSSGSWTAPAAGRSNLVNNNKDLINGINLTGALKVYNTNSAQPATLTMGGIITGTGLVTYTGAGTGGTSLIYSGVFFQTSTNIEFPATSGPANLTINNTLGVNFPTAFNRVLKGKLTLNSGNLAIGDGDTLSLTNTNLGNQLGYTGGFITTGTLGRLFPTSGLPTSAGTSSLFPFGSGANSRLLNVFFSSGTLSGGAAGMIYVSHSPLVDATPISLADNNPVPVTLNKRTNTSWRIGTGDFNLGTGGQTVSITAVGANVGSVNDYSYLRLTDGITPDFGTLIAATGSNSIPTVGKSKLSQADLNKTLYIGSDSHNALVIIIYTWTGLGGNTNWTTAANWTGGVGYPSASTEIAIINSTSGTQPAINSGTSVSVYRLIVGAGMTLTMNGTAGINVFDSVSFNGTTSFAATSTFGYASSINLQSVADLTYGNLWLSGTAQKILPARITITGQYVVAGVLPDILANSNTFVYAGTGAQFITPTNYYNLTITGDRAGQLISLGGSAQMPTDISNVFDISGLSNDTVSAAGSTINFSSTGLQTIPGFFYNGISNSGNGPRILDPLGSADPLHVIHALSFSRGSGAYTVDHSKVNMYVSGTRNTSYGWASFYDLTISGNLKNFALEHEEGALVSVAGTFNIEVTNFRLGTNSFRIYFNGAGDQTITAFKADTTTNTPAFRYNNITIAGGNRNVTLGGGGTDTIAITGNILPEVNGTNSAAFPFAVGKGFIVAGSTINFGGLGSVIPVLKPAANGSSNYNNVNVSSGTRIISGNMTIGGNLSVSGTDPLFATTLTVGNGVSPLAVNILGNLSITGNATIPQGRVNKSSMINRNLKVRP